MSLTRSSAAFCLLIAVFIAASAAAAHEDAGQPTSKTFSAQEGQSSPPGSTRGQPGDDRSLEIAPQPGFLPPDKGVEEIPADRAFRPSDKSASTDKSYQPEETERKKLPPKLPYLGISVQYTLKCYAGQEEHGLEIINVDPNSPAAKAGLKGRPGMTALGAATATAGALLGPLELAVMPLLQKAGQLGQDGDLIVAVDDQRVRSEVDLEEELAKLKPGDTMYLTVLRPLPGGNHKTMKIAVKVGQPGQPTAEAHSSPPPGANDLEQRPY